MKAIPCPISPEQSIALKLLTFFLTVMVVLRHSMNMHLFYAGGNPWLTITDWNIATQRFGTEFTHAAVPGFFLLSGFLFFRNLKSIGDIVPKLKRRVHTLLIPYLAWNVVSLIFWTTLSLLPALHPQMVKSFGLEYSTGWFLSRLTFHPIVGQFWYIRTLIIFVCLSPLIYCVLKSRMLSLLVLYLLVVCWIPIDTGILSTEGAVFFFLGAYLSQNDDLPEKLSFKQWCWLVPLCIFLILQAMFAWLPIQIPFGVNLAVTLYLLWQISLYLGARPSISAILVQLNHHSFFIYALHASLVSGMSVLISRRLPHTASMSFLVFWGAFLSTLLLSLGVSALVKRYLPKVHSIFSGGR